MEQILEALKSNSFFTLVLTFLVALFAYALFKKIIKILAIISLILVLYVAYLVYRGETIIVSKKTLQEYSQKQLNNIKKGAVDKTITHIKKR